MRLTTGSKFDYIVSVGVGQCLYVVVCVEIWTGEKRNFPMRELGFRTEGTGVFRPWNGTKESIAFRRGFFVRPGRVAAAKAASNLGIFSGT